MIMAAYRVILFIVFLSLCQLARTQDSDFSVTPGHIIAKLGFPTRLDCQTTKPNTFVRWGLDDGTTMINLNKCDCVVLPNSSLYFNQTTQSIAGDYTCRLVGGSTAVVMGSITLAVNPVISPSGFSIVQNQSDSFTLSINVTGIPQPSVTWLKDDANFTSQQTGVTANSSGLQVTNARFETAGKYRVRASNCADTDEEFYEIFINFLPIITMASNPDVTEVPVSTTVTLSCSVTSYPESNIHWEQHTHANGDKRLNSSNVGTAVFSRFNVVTMTTITFTSSDINGASSYCCVATNVIGTTRSCLEFTERGAPPAPSGFYATKRTPNSITVRWDQSILDGITYELRYRVEDSVEQWTIFHLQNGETSYTLNNLEPNTSYTLSIISVRNSIISLPTITTVSTRIPVPRNILSFEVDSTLKLGTFVLTWKAPLDSVVDYYLVYIRWWPNNNRTILVNGTNTTLNITDLSENVEYMFAVQAFNDGGSGNVTSYRSSIYCLTLPQITADYTPHGTTVSISWDLSDSVYFNRNIKLVVAEPSREKFTSELINASYRHHCIRNLMPDTRYEIKVIAILGCDNISYALDVLTQSTATTFPSQNCIVFNLTSSESTSAEADSGGVEVWVIVLIVIILLLLAAMIMLGIGMYCACKKMYTSKDPAEVPPVASPSSQAPLNQHMRNHSSSSYSGSLASGAVTPIRSPSSYHSRSTAHRPPLYNGRIDHQQLSVGQQY